METPPNYSHHHHLLTREDDGEEDELSIDPKIRESYELLYKGERREAQCRLPNPEPKAESQCRTLLHAIGAGEADGGKQG
jgi:hypothetical protein